MFTENRLVAAVHTVTRVLAASQDVDQCLRSTLEVAVEAVGAAGGSFLLHDPVGRQLTFSHVLGGKSPNTQATVGFGLLGVSIADNEGIAGTAFQTGKSSVCNDVQKNPQHARRIDEEFQFETLRLATVPVRVPDGAVVGVMQLVNKRSGEFDAEDLTTLDIIASISALSIVLRTANAYAVVQSGSSAASL